MGVLAHPTRDATEVLFVLVEVLSYLLAAFPPATAQGPKLSPTHEQRGGNVPRHHGIKMVTRRFAFDLSVVRCFPRILRKSWAPRNDVSFKLLFVRLHFLDPLPINEHHQSSTLNT